MKSRMNQAVVFDGRNLYEPALVEIFGIEYHGVGRSPRSRQIEDEETVRSRKLADG